VSWSNGSLTLYHGTDQDAATAILSSGVDLSLCSPHTDFGRGFYATTNLDQAKSWGHLRALRINASGKRKTRGAVIEMQVSRDWLGELSALVFVRSAQEVGFADFVRFCRSGASPHRTAENYEVVYGPVAQWQGVSDPAYNLFVIADCDQVSFHTPEVTAAGTPLLANSRRIWIGP
jgi:hypothetical protein